MANVDALERSESHAILKGKLYKHKLINVKRIRGVGALAFSASLYTYLPYIAAFTGSTVPVFGGFIAAIYGLLSMVEGHNIHSIEFISEAGPYDGKLLVKYSTSSFAKREVIVDAKDIKEVASLDNDTRGYNDNDTDHLV